MSAARVTRDRWLHAVGRGAAVGHQILRDALAERRARRVEDCDVANVRRCALFAVMMIMIANTAAINAGTASVITMNQRDRTRSRYSRLATMKIFLSMAGHPCLDARGADTLEEDLME